METTTDNEAAAAAAADAAAASDRTAAPYNGLSTTTAAQLAQLARAALQGSGTPGPFGDATGLGAPRADMPALAAVSAALAGFGGNPGSNPDGSNLPVHGGMTAAESALNSLLGSAGMNLGNYASFGNLGGLQAGLGGLLGDAAGCAAAAGLPPSVLGGRGRDRDQAEADDEGNRGGPGNKQLSSRFRGVCWNKKNKRWQAAINSGGKYLYLGSFTNESDAAKQFDRAAIKIRGKKAKLNFSYSDYVDEHGHLLEDLVLPANNKDDAGAGSGRGKKRNSHAAGGPGDASFCGGASSGGGAGFEGLPGSLMMGGTSNDYAHQTALALGQQDSTWSRGGGAESLLFGAGRGGAGKGGASAALLSMDDLKAILPRGCSLDYMLPGMDSEMFGLVYRHDFSGQRGAALWTGFRFVVFGTYSDEAGVKQTIERSMAMLYEDRQLRGGGGSVGGAHAAVLAAAAAGEQDQLAALGMAGLRGGGPKAGLVGGLGSGAFLGESSSVRSGAEGIGSLANYDIARAARLAQEAAAQQGVSMQMSYPGGMPAGLPGSGGSGVENDLQARLSQIMAQQKGDTQQQQQLHAAVATHQLVDGGMLSRLGNMDLAQLRALTGLQQQGSQQQQQQQQQADGAGHAPQPGAEAGGLAGAAAAGGVGAGSNGPETGGGVSSIEDLVAAMAGGSKRRSTPAAATAAAAAGGSGGGGGQSNSSGGGLTPPPNWPELLGFHGMGGSPAPGAATGGSAGGADSADDVTGPAAKRAKTGDEAAAAAADAAAPAADAAGGAEGLPSAQSSLQHLSKVGLQDALKALCAMTQH